MKDPLRCVYCGRFVKYDYEETGATFEIDMYSESEVVIHWHKTCLDKFAPWLKDVKKR